MRMRKRIPKKKRALEGTENPKRFETYLSISILIERIKKVTPVRIQMREYLSLKYLLRMSSIMIRRRNIDPKMAIILILPMFNPIFLINE